MHDRNGKPLAVGDKVLFEGTITHLDPGEDYCNVNVESDYGRRPDGAKEHISAINTGVLTKVEAVPAPVPGFEGGVPEKPAGHDVNCGCGVTYNTGTNSSQCPDHAAFASPNLSA